MQPIYELPFGGIIPYFGFKMAEGVGFEPTLAIDENGFQDRHLKPLGHPSGLEATIKYYTQKPDKFLWCL